MICRDWPTGEQDQAERARLTSKYEGLQQQLAALERVAEWQSLIAYIDTLRNEPDETSDELEPWPAILGEAPVWWKTRDLWTDD